MNHIFHGCIFPSWQNVYVFSTDEKITGMELYYDNALVHGLRFYTNAGNAFGEMGDMVGVEFQNCLFDRQDLVAIETRSGSWIGAISFHFGDC